MKKRLTAVTMLLATSLVAVGCDSSKVTYKQNSDGKSIIFSIDGYEYTADDLLDDLKDSTTAKSQLYSEVSRKVFTKYAIDTLSKEKLKSIRSDAQEEVEDFKDNCSARAKEEGTDYDTYLESSLKQEGVETLEELEELYYYRGLKDEILDKFVEKTEHYEYFLQKYLETYTPFQVKHVLVAANNADTKFKDGTMTPDNARKLLNVLQRFIDGDSFDTVVELTDDTSSKDNGGIMPFNQAQSYVSEFRFATYAQEIFYKNSDLEDRYNAAVKLHVVDSDVDFGLLAKDAASLTDDEKTKVAEEQEKKTKEMNEFADSNLYSVYKNGIEAIKISDVMALNNPITSDMAGAYNYFKEGRDDIPTIAEQPYEMNVNKYLPDGELNPKYYEEYELQRNQIFNRTLNSHKVQYIELDGEYTNTTNKTTVNVYDHTTGSVVEKEVLAESENGNPIFFALASTGIHFMSMVWNANDPTSVVLTDNQKEGLGSIICDKYDISHDLVTKNAYEEASKSAAITDFDAELNYAYFKLFNSDDKDLSKYQYTYIGRHGAYKSRSALTRNSNDLLNDISNYASYLEYYLFDALVYQEGSALVNLDSDVKYEISFYDKNGKNELYDIMKEYVQDRLSQTDDSFASSVASAAESYGSKLAREAEVKDTLDNWAFKPATSDNGAKA